MKLIVGTAQFGLKYGIKKKKITRNQLKKILNYTKKKKLNYFDTATSYGKSQEILGSIKNKKIISKIIIPKKKIYYPEIWINNHLLNILNETKEKKIFALLFHNTNLISKNKKLIRILEKFKKKKLISNLGISVYSTSDINKVLKFWTPDIIQFPLNIFDQRILDANYLSTLKKKKIILVARSCFLQGIALSNKIKINDRKAIRLHGEFKKWCKTIKTSRLDACINFIKNVKNLDFCVIGIDKLDHLKEINKSFKQKKIKYDFKKFKTNNLNLIDPRKWKKN